MLGIKGLLNLCIIPQTLLQNHQRISIMFGCWLVLINVEMLVMTKKNCSILLIIQIWTKNENWVFSRTLVIDVLWCQSMLQITGCGRKSNAYN